MTYLTSPHEAQWLIDQAASNAQAYIAKIATNPAAQCAVEARLGFEVGQLHSTVRRLCAEIADQKRANERLWEVLADNGLDDRDSEDTELERIDRFNAARDSGAADVLRRVA